MSAPAWKPLYWVASSLRDMKSLPIPVQKVFGHQLRDAQAGHTPADSKPLRGFRGAGVLELIEDFQTDTYRAVYTVSFPGYLYALHVFQKKSRRGAETPKPDKELIRRRYADARRHYQSLLAEGDVSKRVRETYRRAPREDPPVIRASGGNVFADLGLPGADELLAKSGLAIRIRQLIDTQGLTQAQAAERLAATQPIISDVVRGRLEGFSMERLVRFLNALGQDVQIVVRPKPRSRSRATVRTTVRSAAR